MRTRALLSALVALVALAPSAARAEEPRPIFVVATGRGRAADAVAAAVEELARQQVRRDARFSLKSLRAPSAPGPEEALAEAARLIDEGKRAYDELETEAAIEHLTKAVDLLLAYMDALDDKAPLYRALALLGSVHNQSGETEEATDAFRLLATLAPSYSLNEKEHPPSDGRLLLAVQEDLAFAEPGEARISVKEGGPSAAVWVDGVYRGTAPLSLENLEPGTHAFLLRREGYARVAGRLEVGREERQRVSEGLRPLEGLDAIRAALKEVALRDEGGFDPSLARLAEAVGDPAEILVATANADGERLRVRLARVLPARAQVVAFRALTVEKEGFDDVVAAAVAALLDAEEPAPVAQIAAPVVADEAQDATGWILAGATGGVLAVTAVGAASSVALWMASAGPSESWPRSFDPHAVARRQVLGF